MSGPKLSTIKRLFAVSGNCCAFNGCKNKLVDPASGKVLGRICHIKAQNPGGPRFDSNQSDHERHGFGNLILMCPNHHDIIDNDPHTYDVAVLLKLKNKQEKVTANVEPNDDIAKQFQVAFNRRERVIANIRRELKDNLICLVFKDKGKVYPIYFWLNQTRNEQTLSLNEGLRGHVNLSYEQGLACYRFCTSLNIRTRLQNKELQNAITSGEFLHYDDSIEEFVEGSFLEAIRLLVRKVDSCSLYIQNLFTESSSNNNLASMITQLQKQTNSIKIPFQFIANLYLVHDTMEDVVKLSKLVLLHCSNPVSNFSIPILSLESPIEGASLINAVTYHDIDNWINESYTE